jgi:hypothetical protein
VAGLLSTLDLAVDRRVRDANPRRNLRQAKFKIWIPEQQCKDLALLLGAQDGQERWSSLRIVEPRRICGASAIGLALAGAG